MDMVEASNLLGRDYYVSPDSEKIASSPSLKVSIPPKEANTEKHPSYTVKDTEWTEAKRSSSPWVIVLAIIAVFFCLFIVMLMDYFMAGSLSIGLGLYQLGGSVANANSQQFPDNAAAQYNMGFAMLHLDSSEAGLRTADKYFNKAVALNPDPRFEQKIAEDCYDAADAYRAADRTISAYGALRMASSHYQHYVDPNFGPRIYRLSQRIQAGF